MIYSPPANDPSSISQTMLKYVGSFIKTKTNVKLKISKVGSRVNKKGL